MEENKEAYERSKYLRDKFIEELGKVLGEKKMDKIVTLLNLLYEKTVSGDISWFKVGDSYFADIDNPPFQKSFEVQVGVKEERNRYYFGCRLKDDGSSNNRNFLEHIVGDVGKATGTDKIVDIKINELYTLISEYKQSQSEILVDELIRILELKD